MIGKAYGWIKDRWAIWVDVFAAVVAIGVLVVGLVTIVGPALTTTLPGPLTTTATTKTTTDGAQVTTESTAATPTKTDPTKTTNAGSKVTTETSTVTTSGATGLIERFVVASHLTALIGLGLTVVIAFLAGALVQKVLRAQYALTLGPGGLTLPGITAEAAKTSSAALEEIRTSLETQAAATEEALQQVGDALAASAVLSRQIQELRNRMPK